MKSAADMLPHQGRLLNGTHYFALRVYYEDTDFSGFVYHANYLRYAERARSDMLACAGVDQAAAFANGLGSYVVAGIEARYLSPARFDDALLVRTRVIAVRGATIDLDQRVLRQDALLFRATVRAAFIGPDGRPRRQPKEWTSAFGSIMAAGEEAHAQEDEHA